MTLQATREWGQIPVFDFPIDFGGRWVLRDATGEYIDHDQYRHDMQARTDETIVFTDAENVE